MKIWSDKFDVTLATFRKRGGLPRIILLFGADDSQIAEIAQKTMAALPQPLEKIELGGAQLKSDPSILLDEALAISMFGDSRCILARSSGEEALAAVTNLLESDGNPCPVILMAASVTDKAKLVKLVEAAPDGLAVLCNVPNSGTMNAIVRGYADAAGIRLETPMIDAIARYTQGDRRLAKSEVEKLALYLDAAPDRPKTVTQAHIDALKAETEDDGFDAIVDAVLGGDLKALPAEMARLSATGINAVGLTMAMERRVARLMAVAARLGDSSDISGFVERELQARRIWKGESKGMARQLRAWRGGGLVRLGERLIELHEQLIFNSQSADLMLAQALLDIARRAARSSARVG